MKGKPGVLDKFWSAIRTTDFVQKHPVEEVHNSPSTCVPIGIFGDDAGVFSNQKVIPWDKLRYNKERDKHQRKGYHANNRQLKT